MAPTAAVPGHLAPAAAGWSLYEVNIEIDPQIAADYDAWLPGHVDEILRLPGFVHADILVRDDVAAGERAGWRRRTVQYRLTSQAHLDAYFAEHAPRIRADGVARFGGHAYYERRVLTQSAHRSPGQQQLEYCPNCGAVLGGQYCAACGQRSRVRIISLGYLIREAAGDLTHLDSRLWRTMGPLLLRPGVLTNEYLAGRRARYIPPFRLYLGLSIVFFLLASIGSGTPSDLVLFDDGAVAPAGMTQEEWTELRKDVAAGKAEALKELRARGVALPGAREGAPNAAPGAAPATTAPNAAPATPPADAAPATNASSATPATGKTDEFELEPLFTPEEAKPCDGLSLSVNVPGRARFEAGLRQTCHSIAADNGRQFGHALLANIPKMMFVFLPLLALANKLLYPFARRYYVEHLLFFVHFHAFAFLLFSLQALFNLLTGHAAALSGVRGLITFAIVVYVPLYLYKAMRRVYEQGRAATLFKFTLLYVAYFICLTLTLLGGVLYTALTL